MNKKRLYGIDLFRIVAALVVFLFHTGHVDCDYGIMQPFISMGAIFMTGFFVMSGFALMYTYGSAENMCDVEYLKHFFYKRFISVVPMYWVVSILYLIFLNEESVIDNIMLFPVEVLGIQSVFSSLFSVSHNGGTWFISCLNIPMQ